MALPIPASHYAHEQSFAPATRRVQEVPPMTHAPNSSQVSPYDSISTLPGNNPFSHTTTPAGHSHAAHGPSPPPPPPPLSAQQLVSVDMLLMQQQSNMVLAEIQNQHRDALAQIQQQHQAALTQMQQQYQYALATMKQQHDDLCKRQEGTQGQLADLQEKHLALKRNYSAHWRMHAQTVKDYNTALIHFAQPLKEEILKDISVFQLARIVPIIQDTPDSIEKCLDALFFLFDDHPLLFDEGTDSGRRRRYCALRICAGERLGEWLEDAYPDSNAINWEVIEDRMHTAMRRGAPESSMAADEQQTPPNSKKRKA